MYNILGLILLLIGSSIHASQVKTSELMPVEQKVQANFKVVPYDGSVHREAVVKLLGLQSIFSREGLSSCVPFYYCVCINEKGVVIGAMGLWGAESCVAHLDCFAVHEQYQRQGVEEKLLEYHLTIL